MQAREVHPSESEDWLHFFYKTGRRRIPARISRHALETCFRCAAGESLINIYVVNSRVIDDRVHAKLMAPGATSTSRPVTVDARDFEEHKRTMYADLVSSSLVERAAKDLSGKFTADELEAVALWMRRSSAASR